MGMFRTFYRRIRQLFSARFFHHESLFKGSILIIDDDPDIAFVIERVLKLKGCIVYKATGPRTFEKAQALIKDINFDIIFLDLMLNDANGMDILRYIKEFCRYSHVIIVTGNLSMLSGITSYVGVLQKPFEISDFDEILTKHKIPTL